jgi:TatA/E family protein of Tat protein translocase
MGLELFTPMHLIFLALLGLLLFGPKRLPEIGRSLGNGLRELKTTVSGMDGVSEAVNTVNDVRTAASPMNIARATVPGVAEMQDAVKLTPSAPAAEAGEAAPAAAPESQAS